MGKDLDERPGEPLAGGGGGAHRAGRGPGAGAA
jgi:hypothetical protein